MKIIKQFKALSDCTRLRLLNILADYELNVNEIVLIVDMIQSGVSRHLKILLESGLLNSRKQGSYIYYFLRADSKSLPLIEYACARIRSESIFRDDLEKARRIIQVRKNRSRRFFSTVAPQWDRLKREVLGSFDLKHVLGEAIKISESTADLGCGTGELLEYLCSLDTKKLIGVDSSPEMLEQAIIRLSNTSSVELRLGELENLPMRDQEVDTVIMSMVLFHIIEPQKAIKEAFRALKPQGRFFLADFQQHDSEEIQKIIGGAWLGFNTEKICNWLESSGFSINEVKFFDVQHELSIQLFSAQK